MRANQGERSSRLLAATSRGLMTLGETAKARDLALQSLVMTGKPPTASAAWRAMPVLYDAARALNGAADAAELQALLRPEQPPAALNDRSAAFESLLRLSMAAETKEQFDDMGRLAGQAFAMLGRHARRRALSDAVLPPRTRSSLPPPAARISARWRGTIPPSARSTLATYTGMYDTLLRQAQTQFVGDAREQLHLPVQDRQQPARADGACIPRMPRSQRGDRGLDVPSRAAALVRPVDACHAVGRARPRGDRPGLTRPGRAVLHRWRRKAATSCAVGSNRSASRPVAATRWRGAVEGVLPTRRVHKETAKQYDKYVAFVRQKAPGVAELATPRPQPVREFQRRLQGHEAIVATLVTPLDLYVWAITGSSVRLTRHPIGEAEIADKVQRLRAGLLPGGGSLPDVRRGGCARAVPADLRTLGRGTAGREQRCLVRSRPARVGAAGRARHGSSVQAASAHPGGVRGDPIPGRSPRLCGARGPVAVRLAQGPSCREETRAALSGGGRAYALGRGARRHVPHRARTSWRAPTAPVSQ